MNKFILKTLITSVAVLFTAFLLHSGVRVNSTLTAILVAVVMGLLNNFIKPILIILTIPITLFTFGLFLLFINVLIVKWTSDIVPGFRVSGWLYALLFSFIVSFITSVIERLVGGKD
jgi:putative membrane protein